MSNCKGCTHSVPVYGHLSSWLTCHARPPGPVTKTSTSGVHGSRAEWPRVSSEDHCGEHKPTEEPYPEGNAELFMANSFAMKGVGLSIPKEECVWTGAGKVYARKMGILERCPCPSCAPEPECGECGQGSGAKGWVYNSGGFNQGPCPSCAPTPSKED